jgi:GT2 family glycosyltransferase
MPPPKNTKITVLIPGQSTSVATAKTTNQNYECSKSQNVILFGSMPSALIQCVVVLYRQSPMQALSLSSLLQICANDPAIRAKIKILVQDNSPGAPLSQSSLGSDGFEYFHAPTNPGLASAYNRALAMAERGRIPWLLTLDQDTALDRRFFAQLLAALESGESEKVCAYVPGLVNDGLVLSPQIVGKVFYHRVPLGFFGFAAKPLVAFNSGACLSVPALLAIGGFPQEYWLDYLDHIVFFRLQAAGGRVYVLNSQLEHNLSMQDIESGVSLERYSNVLAAEWKFVRDSSSTVGSIVHRVRLLKRALVHALRLRNKYYAIRTMRAAIQRFDSPLESASRPLNLIKRGPLIKP